MILGTRMKHLVELDVEFALDPTGGYQDRPWRPMNASKVGLGLI
jgi:hypothetical protein